MFDMITVKISETIEILKNLDMLVKMSLLEIVLIKL